MLSHMSHMESFGDGPATLMSLGPSPAAGMSSQGKRHGGRHAKAFSVATPAYLCPIPIKSNSPLPSSSSRRKNKYVCRNPRPHSAIFKVWPLLQQIEKCNIWRNTSISHLKRNSPNVASNSSAWRNEWSNASFLYSWSYFTIWIPRFLCSPDKWRNWKRLLCSSHHNQRCFRPFVRLKEPLLVTHH